MPQLPRPYKPLLPGQQYSSGSYSYTPEEEENPEVYYSDSRDPLQVNSLLDVLSKSFDPVENGGHIFSLATLAEAGMEWWDRLVKPWTEHKDPIGVLNNSLVGFGEAVDILSNIVKAQLPSSWTSRKYYEDLPDYSILDNFFWKDSWKRFKYSIGIGVEGRYTFDMDVNVFGEDNPLLNGIVNLIGEIAFDPITWVTVGVGATAKFGVAGASVKEALESSPDKLARAVLQQIDTGKVSKKLAESFLKGNKDEFTNTFAMHLSKQLKRSGVKIDYLLNKKSIETLGWNIFKQAEEIATNKFNIKLLRRLGKFVSATEKFDKYLTRVAGMPILTPTAMIAKWGGGQIAGYVAHVVTRSTDPLQVYVKGRNVGINIKRADEVRDRVQKELAKFNLTGEFADVDMTQFAQEFSDRMIAVSVQSQTMVLRRIVFEASDDIELQENLLKAAKEFLGEDATIKQYLEVCQNEIAKSPMLQGKLSDTVITELKRLGDVEELIAKQAKKLKASRECTEYIQTEILSLKIFEQLENAAYCGYKDAEVYRDEETYKIGIRRAAKRIAEAFLKDDWKEFGGLIEAFLKGNDKIFEKVAEAFLKGNNKEFEELVEAFLKGSKKGVEYIEIALKKVDPSLPNYAIKDLSNVLRRKLITDKVSVEVAEAFLKGIKKEFENFVEDFLKGSKGKFNIELTQLGLIGKARLRYAPKGPITESPQAISRRLLRNKDKLFKDLDSRLARAIDILGGSPTARIPPEALESIKKAVQERIGYSYAAYKVAYDKLAIFLDDVDPSMLQMYPIEEISKMFGEDPIMGFIEAQNDFLKSLEDLVKSVSSIEEQVLSVQSIKKLYMVALSQDEKFRAVYAMISKLMGDSAMYKTPADFGKDATLSKMGINLEDVKLRIKDIFKKLNDYEITSEDLIRKDLRRGGASLEELRQEGWTLEDLIPKDNLVEGVTLEDLIQEGYTLEEIILEVATIEDMINFAFKNVTDDNVNEFYKAVDNIIQNLEDIKNRMLLEKIDNWTPDIGARFSESNYYKPIEEAIREIENLVDNKRFIYEDGHVYIALRTERFTQTLDMITGEVPERLYDLFDVSTDIGAELHHYRETLQYAKNNPTALMLIGLFDELEKSVNYMMAQRQFAEYAGYVFRDTSKWFAFMETLQNFGEDDLASLLSESTHWAFIDRLQKNLDAVYMDKRMSLGSYRGRLKDANNPIQQTFNKYFDPSLKKRMFYDGHVDSGSDTLMTKLVILHESPELQAGLDLWLQEHPGQKIALFDIEFSEMFDPSKDSLNRWTGRIQELTVLNYETNEPVTFRLEGLRKFYQKEIEGQVIYIPGDDDLSLLNAFNEYLVNNNVGKVLGMNTSAFDVPTMKHRWLQGKPDDFHNSRFRSLIYDVPNGHVDIYNVIRRAQNIPVLEYSDIENIEEMLENYALDMHKLGYGKVQSIRPHETINKLRELEAFSYRYNKELEQAYNEGRRAKAQYNIEGVDHYEDATSEGMHTYGVDNSGISLYIEDTLKLLDDQDSKMDKGADWNVVFFRDLSKEHATERNIEELSKRMNMEPEQVKMLLREDLGFSGNDLKILFAGDSKAPGFEPLRLQADQWYRLHFMQTVLGEPGETFDAFKLRFLKSRAEWTNFEQMFFGMGESRFMMHRNISNPERISKYFEPKELGEATFDKTQKKLMDKTTEIEKLINYRIKDEQAIFQIGLFDNFDELRRTVEQLVEQADPDNWISQIDLTKLSTPKEYFAVWYSIAHERIFTAYDGGILNVSKALSRHDDALIKRNVFLRVKRNIFLDYDTALLDFQDEMRDIVWETVSASYRAASLFETMDAVPGAGAREYASRMIGLDARKMAREIDQMDPFAYAEYNRAVRAYQKTRVDLNDMDYMTKVLDGEKGIDFLIADIFFNGSFCKRIPYFSEADAFKPLDANGWTHMILAGRLKQLEPKLRARGIGMVDEDSVLYIFPLGNRAWSPDYLNDGVSFGGKIYIAPEYELNLLDEHIPGIPDEHIKTLNNMLKYSAERGTFKGTGTILTTDILRKRYDNLPEAVKDQILPFKDILESGYFNKLRFDNSYVGPLELQHGAGYSKDMISEIYRGYMYTLNSQTSKDLFLDLYLSARHGMDLSSTGFFKGLSDAEIIEFFKKDDNLIVAEVIQDKSFQGCHLRRLRINNMEDLRLARERNAILMPYQVYSNSFEEINNNIQASFRAPKGIDVTQWADDDVRAFLKDKPLPMLREVMYFYKLAYLADPGVVFRNMIDSTLKAIEDTGDPIGVVKNVIRGNKMLVDYDKTIKIMQNLIPEKELHYNTSGFKKFFNKARELRVNLPMDEETFFFVRSVVINGPSISESKIITNWIAERAEEAAKKAGKPRAGAIHSLLHKTGNTVMTPMGLVESRIRLAQYLTLMDQGVTKTQAFSRVSRAAFDYATKSKVDKAVEYIMPFYTFQKLNLNYWLDVYFNNPVMVRALDDFRKVSWNTFNVTPEEIQTQRSLQYHIMSGNLQLDPTSGLVLKLNPSQIDVLNLMADPKSNILRQIFAPLQNFIKYKFEDDELERQRKELLEGTYPIAFGKFKGEPISTLITEENMPYAQWLLTEKWFHDYNKPMYDYLMYKEVYKDPKMPWGKYRGQSMDSVPQHYRDFLSEQPWFNDKYSYIADIWNTGRDTILPEELLDNEPILDFAEAEGLIAAGMYKRDIGKHLQDIAEKTLKDVSTYPVLGVISQRYTGEESTARKSHQRLTEAGKPVQATIAKMLPGVFGAVKRYEEFKENEKYYSPYPKKSTPQSRRYGNNYKYYRYYPPKRTKNFYYGLNQSGHRNRGYFDQAQFTQFTIKKLRTNIYQLHF